MHTGMAQECDCMYLCSGQDGDKELGNYLGIAEQHIWKVFERVINIRIRVVAEEVVMKEPKEVSERQKLCGPDLGTEKCSGTEGLKRVIAFLDVKKAYDTSTVWREGLWRNNRIAEKLVNGASCSTREQIEAAEVTGRGSTE